MRHQQNAVFDALQRAGPFLDEHAAALAGVVDLTAAHHRLDQVVTSFTAHAVDQDVGDRGAKGETAKQHQLRGNLRSQQMKPIAVIARGNLRTTPEFKALQMPEPSAHGPAFIASAQGMLEAATIHKDTLVAHGMPSTFIDDFQAALGKLEESLEEREKNRQRRIAATKGLDTQEKQGRTVLSVLDALMRQALAGNESLLRAWKGARLIRRRPGGATTPAAAPTVTAGTAPVVTPLPVSESPSAAAA
jgi:hypothetical protein